jgi:hypothetical protein
MVYLVFLTTTSCLNLVEICICDTRSTYLSEFKFEMLCYDELFAVFAVCTKNDDCPWTECFWQPCQQRSAMVQQQKHFKKQV